MTLKSYLCGWALIVIGGIVLFFDCIVLMSGAMASAFGNVPGIEFPIIFWSLAVFGVICMLAGSYYVKVVKVEGG